MLWNKNNAARIEVICQGASSTHHFLLARLTVYSFQFVFQLVSLPYTLQIPSISVLPTALKTFCWNKLGILTGTSWHFFNISSDISALWAHESTSLDINKAYGMLASNARSIFCNNVTCFGTNKCCSNRSHLSGCFKCSSLLACEAARAELSVCFPISLSHTPYSFPLSASCRLLSRHSVRTSWEFSLEQVGISPTYQVTYVLCGRTKVPHLISIRLMQFWLATQNHLLRHCHMLCNK